MRLFLFAVVLLIECGIVPPPTDHGGAMVVLLAFVVTAVSLSGFLTKRFGGS